MPPTLTCADCGAAFLPGAPCTPGCPAIADRTAKAAQLRAWRARRPKAPRRLPPLRRPLDADALARLAARHAAGEALEVLARDAGLSGGERLAVQLRRAGHYVRPAGVRLAPWLAEAARDAYRAGETVPAIAARLGVAPLLVAQTVGHEAGDASFYCCWCGRRFEPAVARQKSCSPECRRAYRHAYICQKNRERRARAAARPE